MSKIDLTCIIDDDPIYIFGAKRVLQVANFSNTFMIFKNGKDALDALEPLLKQDQNMPGVILLDINMPIMDGWQFLDKFVALNTNPYIQIYIVSSSIDPRDIEKAKTYDIVKGYILKPISLEKIQESILSA